MKLLHCIPSLGSGGAERQCVILAAGLAARGHEVHVAYVRRGDTDYLQHLEQGGVTTHHLGRGRGVPGNIWRAQKNPLVLWRLGRLIRRLRPEIVQSWNRPMDVFCGMLVRLHRFPWILSERGGGMMYDNRRERLRVWAAGRAGAIVANSPGGADYWRDKVPPLVRVEVIPNAVAAAELLADSTPVDWPADFPPQRTMVYVGRLSAEKNIGVLLEALSRLARDGRARAILCGQGELLEETRAEIRRRGLENSILALGFVPRPWQWMKRAAAMVSISLTEGHPNAVIEAMAVGCPLVVSDIPAHRAFLDESSAVLVRTEDAGAVAEAIAAVLDDPAGATARAERARIISTAWTPERFLDRFEALYGRLAGHSDKVQP